MLSEKERARNSVAYLSNLFWFFSVRLLQLRPHSMEPLCYSRHPHCRTVIPLRSALLNLTRWHQLFREESSRRPIVAVVVHVDVVAGRRDQFHQLHQQLNNLEVIGAPSYGIDKHCRGEKRRKEKKRDSKYLRYDNPDHKGQLM